MGLHQGGVVRRAGRPLADAAGALIMLHGRGASAEDILGLARLLAADELAQLAPQAANNTWYPYPFTAALAQNEPWLSSALARVGELVAEVADAGIALERTYLLGFSQGACLALEYAARHATRYGGVFGLSGGLIGPDGTPRDYAGSLAGTPVFLGCSDVDFHIARRRVIEAGAVFERLGAAVTVRLYPGMGHTVNEDELAFVREVLAAR